MLSPLGYALGAVKTVLLLALALVYFLLVQVVCLVFVSVFVSPPYLPIHKTRYQLPIRPLHRAITHLLTALLSRLALFLVGLYWIPVEVVARKRG